MDTRHEPFSIEIAGLDHWQGRNRKNNFFELVYILEGKGVQWVNYMHSPYQKGSIFLLPASNAHTFIIGETTTFLFIRFTARFFRDDKDCITDFGKWFCRLNFIIGNYNRTAGDIVHDRSDRLIIDQLITLVQEENRKADRHSRRIMQGMMVSILEIIARNVENRKMTPAESGDSKFAGMLLHIQFNLLDEDKVNPRYLCAKFHIAETYFSEYFKKNAGEKFQDFILLSRLRLAEARALYTDSSFKEIAYDLGFTDSSHLNRMMKKFLSKKLSDIRRESVAEREKAA